MSKIVMSATRNLKLVQQAGQRFRLARTHVCVPNAQTGSGHGKRREMQAGAKAGTPRHREIPKRPVLIKGEKP